MPAKRDSIVRLFPSLGELLRNPTVQRIFVDAPDRVFVERNGRIAHHEVKWSAADLNSAIRTLSGPIGANAAKTGFAVTKDGIRISGHPVGQGQPLALVFECGQRPSADLGELVRTDAVTKSAAAFLSLALRAGVNIGVVGQPGGLRDRWVSALLDGMTFGTRVGQIGALDPSPTRPDLLHLGSVQMATGTRQLEQSFDAASEMKLDRLAIGELGGPSVALVRQLASRRVPIVMALTGESPSDTFLRFAALARAADALGSEVDALVATSFDVLIGIGRGDAGRVEWIDAVRIEGDAAVTERLFERSNPSSPLEERDGAAALWMRWENWIMSPMGRVSRNVVSTAPPPSRAITPRASDPGVGRGTVEIRPAPGNAPIAGTASGGAIDDRPTRIDVIADPPPRGRPRSYSDILRSVEAGGADDSSDVVASQAQPKERPESKPLPRLRAPKSRDS